MQRIKRLFDGMFPAYALLAVMCILLVYHAYQGTLFQHC